MIQRTIIIKRIKMIQRTTIISRIKMIQRTKIIRRIKWFKDLHSTSIRRIKNNSKNYNHKADINYLKLKNYKKWFKDKHLKDG